MLILCIIEYLKTRKNYLYIEPYGYYLVILDFVIMNIKDKSTIKFYVRHVHNNRTTLFKDNRKTA